MHPSYCPQSRDNSLVLDQFESLVKPLGIRRVSYSSFEALGVECEIGFATTVEGAMEAVLYCVEVHGKRKGITEQKTNTRLALHELMDM